MALLATHQIQGSYAPSSPSWKRRIKLTQSRMALCTVQRMHVHLLKHTSCLHIPLLLIVNMKYGAQVAKELSPLWISGPLLGALYIKIIQVLCSLYVFRFKQSVKAVKNFTGGNDKESIRAHVWERVVYFRNLDYKDESKRIWKDFQAWLEDKCLDIVESMWSYRGLVGFMKSSRLARLNRQTV